MKVLSLFDGMSCGQIALNKLGVSVEDYFASEVDKYAIQIAKKNFPTTKHIGDVRDISSNMLPSIDLLIGGSPCQNFSFSGSKKGMRTKENLEVTTLEQYLNLKEDGFEFNGQSYLFWEYVRLLKEVKPKYFLLENVNMSTKWKDLISNTLGVQPIKIQSSSVSAQSRTRLYWTNIPNVEVPKNKGIVLGDILEPKESFKLPQHVQDRLKIYDKPKGIVYGDTKKETTKIGQRDECFSLEGISGCLTATMYKQPPQYIYKNEAYKLSPTDCEKLQTVPIGYTEGVSNSQRYKMLGNGWTVDVVAHILSFIE